MYNLPLRSTNSPHGGSGSGGNSTVGTPTSSVSDFAKLTNLKNSSNNSSGKGGSSSSGGSSGDGHCGVMPMYNLSLRPTSTGGHSSNGGTPRSPGNDLVRSGINHGNNNNGNSSNNNNSNGNSGSGGGGGGGGGGGSSSNSSSGSGSGGVMPMYTLPLRSTGNNGSPRLWSTSSQIEEPPVKSPSQMYALPVKSSSQINAKETRDNVVPVGAMYVLPSKHNHSASQMAQSNLLAPSQIAQSNQSYEDRFSRVRAWVNDFLSYHTTSTTVHDKSSSALGDQSSSLSSSSSSSSSSTLDLYEWLRTGEVLCELMMKLRGPDGKYTNLGNNSGE